MPTINEVMTAPLTQLQNMFNSMNAMNVNALSQIQNMIQNVPTPFGSINGFPALPPIHTFNGTIQPAPQPVQPINGATRYTTTSALRTTTPSTVKKINLEVL